MAQNDLVIANQSFPSFRTDLNSALQAINTSHSGTSRPSGAVAGTIWLDTTGTPTANTLKFFDGTDDISLATINYTANTVDWLDSTVSITGLSTTATGTVLTLSNSDITSTVNLIIDNDKEIRFREATTNGVNYVSLSAPASLSANLTFTLPSADGTSGQFLKTDGAGNLSFSSLSFATPLAVVGDATAGASIRLPEDTDNGSNYVAIKAPDNLASNLTLTLPSADGTSGQVLQTNGSGVLSFSSPSSDFVLLATTDASSSSSVSFDGYFSSTYKNYQLIISDLLPVSSTVLRCRFRRSNADVTASNYTKAGYQSYITSGGNALSNTTFYNYDGIDMSRNSIRVASSAQGYFAFITIFNPLNTSSYKRILCSQSYSSDDAGGTGGSGFFNEQFSSTLQDSTSALSGISFFMGTGNISSGNFKLYGIK